MTFWSMSRTWVASYFLKMDMDTRATFPNVLTYAKLWEVIVTIARPWFQAAMNIILIWNQAINQTDFKKDRFVDDWQQNSFKSKNTTHYHNCFSLTCTDSSQGLYHHPLVFKATGRGLEDVKKNLLEENLLTQHHSTCIINLIIFIYMFYLE